MNTPSQQAEPTDAQAMNIAFKAFGYADHETFCAGWRAKADHVFDTQAAAVAQPTDFQILAITTAYEQGFGHGLEHRGLPNPYSDAYLIKAWDHGYEVGSRRAAAPVAQPSAEPVGWMSPGQIRPIYTESKFIAEQWLADGAKVVPLYAHPAGAGEPTEPGAEKNATPDIPRGTERHVTVDDPFVTRDGVWKARVIAPAGLNILGPAIGRAVCVFNDVLGDIENWEDKALAEAVVEARDGLLSGMLKQEIADFSSVAGAGEQPSEAPK